MSTDALGYYAILEVLPNADDAEIKQRYRELAKIWHPDHSQKENALDVFQKISNAYEILKDEQKRLTYDLLCRAYDKHKFPDMFSLKELYSKKIPQSNNIYMLNLTSVKSWLLGYKSQEHRFIVTNKEAIQKEFYYSCYNWLLGWWHPKGFVKNIESIIENFRTPIKNADNLTLYIHNALACFQEKKYNKSAFFAKAAMRYADNDTQKLLQRFIGLLDVETTDVLRNCNTSQIRYVQLSFPLAIMFLILLSFSSKIVTEADLMQYFTKKKEVSYYQEVNFKDGRGVDDVVVGKVINIPVDKKDDSRLYHLKADSKIMYGPSDDFDVLTFLPSRTTVRITGITPDELWLRVMLDNGEMGFVRREHLSQGIGKKIPESSKIISQE